MLGIAELAKKLLTSKVEVVVDVSAGQVFSYLADIKRHTEWLRYDAVRKASQGPVGVGSVFIATTRQESVFVSGSGYGRRTVKTVRSRLQVTEFVPGERLAYEVEHLGRRDRYVFEL